MTADAAPLQLRYDLEGGLRNNLANYEVTSILREQAQNADDACHKQERPGWLVVRFERDQLVFENASEMLPEDWERITTIAAGGKSGDSQQTGEFGIGFWSVLHLTDAPVIWSYGQRCRIDVATRHITHIASRPFQGTRFELPYRRTMTGLAERLGVPTVSMEKLRGMRDAFLRQMADLLLFTRSLERIELVTEDDRRYVAARATKPVGARVDEIEITLTQPGGSTVQRFLKVSGEHLRPMPGRDPKVEIAFPLEATKAAMGRVFITFPTEVTTGAGFHINAHFHTGQERRSISSEGDYREWNDGLFRTAGEIVGRLLPDIFNIFNATPDDDDGEMVLGWFVRQQDLTGAAGRRASLCLDTIDEHARRQELLFDREGELRRGAELVLFHDDLPERLLGPHITESVPTPSDPRLKDVLRRWGVRCWTKADVAAWLAANAPSPGTPLSRAPAFLRPANNLSKLLRYCERGWDRLEGAALSLGTDGRLYPLGSRGLRRPAGRFAHLVEGLSTPVVAEPMRETLAWKHALDVDLPWLRDALRALAPSVTGKRVPLSGMGCFSQLSRVQEVIELLRTANLKLEGTPLAVDENRQIGVFNDDVIVGLPDGKLREAATRLVRYFGLAPLHRKIDDPRIEAVGGKRWSVGFLIELVQHDEEWVAVDTSALLLATIRAMDDDGRLPSAAVDRLADLPIWPDREGNARPLRKLYLPTDTSAMAEGLADRVIHLAVLADPEYGKPAADALREIFRMGRLDTTEELVYACESPPTSKAKLLQLLEELVDHKRKLSESQRGRLATSAIVPCHGPRPVAPGAALIVHQKLPSPLEERRVVEEILRDHRISEFLQGLGATDRPTVEDLAQAARSIAGTPVTDISTDPDQLLWSYLVDQHAYYADLSPLAAIPWVASEPGPRRRRPQDLLDPLWRFATLLHPIPAGKGSPPGPMRDKLGIRAALTAPQCAELAIAAARQGARLPDPFFIHLENLARSKENELTLGRLRDVKLIPVAGGELRAPSEFVTRERFEVWGHLKLHLDEGFAKSYPNLVRLWSIAAPDGIPAHEHIEVLRVLADLEELSERDLQLARARIRSLAELCAEDKRYLVGLESKPCVLTSHGLTLPGAAYQADLPLPVVRRLQGHLPVVAEIDKAGARLYDLLDEGGIRLRSLRGSVTLTYESGTRVRVPSWEERLQVHRHNAYRFFHHSASSSAVSVGFDERLWPPRVERVSSLTVRATLAGQELTSWKPSAFLAEEGGALRLLVVGDGNRLEDLVDALAAHFGVELGTKTLLAKVLECATPSEGAKWLDWEDVPEPPRQHDPAPATWDPERVEIPTVPSHERPQLPVESLDVRGAAEATAPSPSPPGSREPRARRPQPGTVPKPRTDFAGLEERGYKVRRVAGQRVEDLTLHEEKEGQGGRRRVPSRVTLSFIDVQEGCLPLRRVHAERLAQGQPVSAVRLFGEKFPARHVDRYDWLRIKDGDLLFAERDIVPGTVVRLRPGSPGVIDLEVREDPHEITDVWMLSIDEKGILRRTRTEAVTVRYETDGPLYKAERRWEDLRALHAEATESALELIIRAFERFGEHGLTADEVWDAVAMHRLFAKSTIASHLSAQKEFFERGPDGRWYMNRGKTIHIREDVASSSEEAEVLSLTQRLAKLLKRRTHLRGMVAAELGFLLPDASRSHVTH